ncbi:MAG: alpha/beta hydrolase fold domain-containing protein [Halioglobus sp.]
MASSLDSAVTLTPAVRLAGLTELGLVNAIKSERAKVLRWLDHAYARIENRIVERVLLNRIRAAFPHISDPTAVTTQLQNYREAYSIGKMSTLANPIAQAMSSAAVHLRSANNAPANAAWLSDPSNAAGILLYTAGGGFILPPSRAQIDCAQRLGAASDCAVLLNQHSLSPEAPFPVPIEETIALLQWLGQEFPDKKVVVAADTAGASISLGALLQMRNNAEAQPAGLLLFSPWADLSLSGWSYITKSSTSDSPFRMETAAFCAKIYLQEASSNNPLASAIYADADDLPPFSIHTSEYDMHFDDALKLVEKANTAGVSAKMNYWDSPRHHLERFNNKEAKDSIALAAAFITTCLQTRSQGRLG